MLTNMIELFGLTTIALYLAVAVLLIRKHRRTGDAGLLWLGLPLVLLPLLSLPLALWLQAGVDRLIQGEHVNRFPFTLVEQGRLTLGSLLTGLNVLQHVVWGVLSLAAVLALRRDRGDIGNGKRETGDGRRETGDGGRGTGDGRRGTGDGGRETGNGRRETGLKANVQPKTGSCCAGLRVTAIDETGCP